VCGLIERGAIMTDDGPGGRAVNKDPDPWEERLRFGQLFLRYLDTLGRPFLPEGQPPMTVADYLEMLALGEMLAETDHSCAAARR
jgi:hypothetical protein